MNDEERQALLKSLRADLDRLEKQKAEVAAHAKIAGGVRSGPSPNDKLNRSIEEDRAATAMYDVIKKNQQAVQSQIEAIEAAIKNPSNKEQSTDRATQQKDAIAYALYIGKKTERAGPEETLTKEFNRQAERDRD